MAVLLADAVETNHEVHAGGKKREAAVTRIAAKTKAR
jgi:hypothetical protein